MKTNRSPLNKQDQDSHEFDHKPAQSEIEKAKFINNKLKKMRKKRLNYELGTKELDAMEAGTSKNVVEDVVVNAPKKYKQIKDKDGSQLMTASEAKITDETGFRPDSVKDKEFKGGPNRNSRETDSINSVNAWKAHKAQYLKKPGGEKEYDMEKGEFYYNTDENKMKMIPTDDGEQKNKVFMGNLQNYQLAPERKSALNMLGISRKSSPLNELSPKCWAGYSPGAKTGVKTKKGKDGDPVNNCEKD